MCRMMADMNDKFKEEFREFWEKTYLPCSDCNGPKRDDDGNPFCPFSKDVVIDRACPLNP